MFDKFGEFDSVEELNRAAAAQLKERDMEALGLLAEENGIPKEDLGGYVNGTTQDFATPLTAAVGKLNVETGEYELRGILADWTKELIDLCMDSEDFCRAVRKKGKTLAEYIARTADYGYENRVNVDRRIVERTKHIKGVTGTHPFSIGIPDKRTRKKIAKKYYLEEGQE